MHTTQASVAARHPIRRDLIWEGGTFSLELPADMRVNYGSAHVGHPYAQIFNRRVEGGLVETFAHQCKPKEPLGRMRGKHCSCRLEVWRRMYADGSIRFCLDYTPTKKRVKITRKLRVLSREKAGERPKGIGGTIISITLPGGSGFILIGDKRGTMY